MCVTLLPFDVSSTSNLKLISLSDSSRTSSFFPRRPTTWHLPNGGNVSVAHRDFAVYEQTPIFYDPKGSTKLPVDCIVAGDSTNDCAHDTAENDGAPFLERLRHYRCLFLTSLEK